MLISKYITITDVALELGVCKATVTKLVKDGVIPSIRVGNVYRIPKEKFEDWINGQET